MLHSITNLNGHNTTGGHHETERTQQFQGSVTKITEGQAMAEVVVKVGNLDFVAAITEGSVKNWG
jgi:hypothetical protein